ncbi:MAG: SMC-Scp complex subunit ScpB [Clostridia bacterium]|nr:SMC-Scp complex subunit ScpB [Clostridia bacterium]
MNEIQRIESAIEAILFVSGEGVSIDKFIETFELSKSKMQKILNSFVDKYNYASGGLKILHYGDFYQLSTNPDLYEYLNKFAGIKKANTLSRAALEVLSIIVYNQPVTRSTIDKIRGVDSFGPLKKLLDREIVEEQGRLEAPGLPILYGTTPEFLKLFGLKSLDDVPDLDTMQMSIFDADSVEDSTDISPEEDENQCV